MSCSYTTVIDLDVCHNEGYSSEVVKVRVAKGQISVTSPKIDGNSAWYAETMAKTVLAAVTRARRIHRRVFGTRAP